MKTLITKIKKNAIQKRHANAKHFTALSILLVILTVFSFQAGRETEKANFAVPDLVPVARAEVIDKSEKPLTSEPSMQEWVRTEITKAGLSAFEAEVIIRCESRWNPDAVNVNKNGTWDGGLFQINSIHKDISAADRFDYKKATAWAIQKRLKDGNWSAWVCAKNL